MLKNVFYLCGLLFVSCLFSANRADANIYFLGGSDGTKFFSKEPKTSYCPAGYSTTISSCPDGQTTETSSISPKCKKCAGVACKTNYGTKTTCSDGQTMIYQSDNTNCKGCSGTACSIASGYATTNSCKDGQTTSTQSTNTKCIKCSGTACSANYATGRTCSDGQTTNKQSTNTSCINCSGTACITGYSTGTTSCLVGQTLSPQGTNSSCKQCTGVACNSGYGTSVSCADGQSYSYQSTNTVCKKCSGTACSGDYNTWTSSCSSGQQIAYQSSNSACKKCEEAAITTNEDGEWMDCSGIGSSGAVGTCNSCNMVISTSGGGWNADTSTCIRQDATGINATFGGYGAYSNVAIPSSGLCLGSVDLSFWNHVTVCGGPLRLQQLHIGMHGNLAESHVTFNNPVHVNKVIYFTPGSTVRFNGGISGSYVCKLITDWDLPINEFPCPF